MKASFIKETFPGETRVALVPGVIPQLIKSGLEIEFESGAGLSAGYTDEEYKEKGAKAVSRSEALQADILLQVRSLGANPSGRADVDGAKTGQIVIGFSDPLGNPEAAQLYANKKLISFSMELIPRISRAQSMDALSSMASIAGYKAVITAAEKLPKMFPMMMTAAGTIKPAKVFVIGAGVAGLQAIATAKRLGAFVEAYDVRPEVEEQIRSLGGRFIKFELETGESQDKGGYAKALGEEFYKKQAELMMGVVKDCDVVITTAAIPGKKSPVLITAPMVDAMHEGSVIVDLAAERGGNCEKTVADETTITDNLVTILGPTNLPASVPFHASQMYAKNITTLLLHLVKEGKLVEQEEDEIFKETLVTRGGEVAHDRVKSLLGKGEAA